jgi:hypothetical protein
MGLCRGRLDQFPHGDQLGFHVRARSGCYNPGRTNYFIFVHNPEDAGAAQTIHVDWGTNLVSTLAYDTMSVAENFLNLPWNPDATRLHQRRGDEIHRARRDQPDAAIE